MLSTIVIYNLLLFLSLFLCNQAKCLEKKYLLWWGYFLIFLIGAIRFDIGYDYDSYYQLCDDLAYEIGQGNFLRVILFNEPFVSIMSFLFGKMPYTYIWVIDAYFLITILFLYLINDQYHCHTKGIYVFFTLGVFFFTLDVIRQGLAMFIFFYSIKYIENKKIVKYFVCILLATCVHYSALLLIPFYFLLRIKPKVLLYVIIVILLLIGYYYRVWETCRDFVFQNIPFYSQRYMDNVDQMRSINLSSGLGMILNVCLAVIVILSMNKRKPIMTNLAFAGIVIYLFANGNYNIERVSYYFFYFLTISLPLSLRHNRQIGWIVFFCLFVLFQKHIITGPRGTTPYQTIFSPEFENQYFKPDF